EAVHAGAGQRGEGRGAAVVGVGLDGHLAGLAERARDGRAHAAELVGAPERGRAAAEADRDQPAGEPRRARLELGEDLVGVAGVRDLLERRDGDGEVAVGAAGAAPREVDVDAEVYSQLRTRPTSRSMAVTGASTCLATSDAARTATPTRFIQAI